MESGNYSTRDERPARRVESRVTPIAPIKFDGKIYRPGDVVSTSDPVYFENRSRFRMLGGAPTEARPYGADVPESDDEEEDADDES